MYRRLHLDTSNVESNQRYSFLETPLEMQAPGVQTSQQQQPPPWAASNPDSLQGHVDPEKVQPQALPPLNEKVQHLQHEGAAFIYPGGPNVQEHPANYAPFADEVPQQIQQHDAVVPNYSYVVPPPNSPGPLPTKSNLEPPRQIARAHTVAIAPDMNPLQSPQLPYFPGPPTASRAPQAPADDAAHGAIAYLNVQTYGHVALGSVALVCWLMATVQRGRTRKAYGIQGDIASDCVRATCCTCCTLIQDETEIKKREEERLRTARATGTTFVSPYMAPMQMSYGPTQR
ncbi:hypothetical protein BBP40_004532 [Aspergillus hancockii]|nr:hypothetical protein BBP40_004532 [Aspergillus hancockii]